MSASVTAPADAVEVGVGVGVGVALAAGVVPVSVTVPELWPLTVKLVVSECAPAVCGTNAYVKRQDAPGANVAPEQVWVTVKLGSPGAPPTTLSVCGADDLFVTTTSRPAEVLPTAVVGKVSEVGVIVKVSVVPDSEIVPELWPLIVKLVVAVCGPVVWGVNEYVTLQDPPAASVTPAQA